MKYALAFGCIGLGLVASGIINPPLRLLLFWAGVSFFWVGSGYAGLGAGVLGKHPGDGRTRWPFKGLLLPYFLLTWSTWHLIRALSKEAPVDQVDERLSIGRRLLAGEVAGRFDHYVDLTAEFEDPRQIRESTAYRCLPILDGEIPRERSLRPLLDEVGTGTVYVHCAQGHGRTGLFAIALLMHRGVVTDVREGLKLLQRHRQRLDLNRRQLEFLEREFAASSSG